MHEVINVILAVILPFLLGVFYISNKWIYCDHKWLQGAFVSVDKQVFLVCKKCQKMRNVTNNRVDDGDDALPVVARKNNVIHVDFTSNNLK